MLRTGCKPNYAPPVGRLSNAGIGTPPRSDKFELGTQQILCGYRTRVNGGYGLLTEIPATPGLDLLNLLKAEVPKVWDEEPFDAIPFHSPSSM
jgi:hypothetical protein